MALTFPLSLADLANLLPIASVKLRLARVQDASGLANGDVNVADFNTAKWIGEVRLGAMSRLEAGIAESRIEALQGSVQAFFVCPPQRPYPYSDPAGTAITPAAPKINSIGTGRRAIAIKEAPANFVFNAGDWFHLDYGGRRYLHRLAEGATASGFGLVSTQLQIVPSLPSGVAPNQVLSFALPAGRFILQPGSWQPGDTVNTVTRGASFSIVEKRI